MSKLIKVSKAFKAYMAGQIDGWALHRVVAEAGFTGFSVDKTGTLTLYRNNKTYMKL